MNAPPSIIDPGPYHRGELAVQERAGVRAMAARAGNAYRDHLPEIARAFVAQQRWVFAGGADAKGQVWASAWTGKPGFARGDVERLTIAVAPDGDDPLHTSLRAGQEIGVLAIDLASRKRMRVNGTVESLDPVVLRTEQVYSNCPKFIQRRTVTGLPPRRNQASGTRVGDRLDADARAVIAQADTFFIASGVTGNGFDVSHRGGAPGFVETTADRLTWGDYAGNTMFNTLGNLATDPRAGLLFIEFASGDALQVTGEATIDWDAERASRRPGAERLVSFEVTGVVYRPGALAFTFGAPEPSPFNL